MPGKYDAYIFEAEDGSYKVRPAVAVVEHKAKFKIVNTTALPAQIRIEGAHLKSAQTEVKQADPGKKAEFELVEQALQDRGKAFSYKIRLATDDWQFLPVHAESDPVIIIDPPNP
jgi:hypothetical protein